jgi:hypothetical protein
MSPFRSLSILNTNPGVNNHRAKLAYQLLIAMSMTWSAVIYPLTDAKYFFFQTPWPHFLRSELKR